MKWVRSLIDTYLFADRDEFDGGAGIAPGSFHAATGLRR